MRVLVSAVFFLSFIQRPLAQSDIPIETWRTHFSYQDSRIIEVTPERIYVAAEHGLFYLNRSDNALQILSKNDGLSDVGITAMRYTSGVGLILAYRSGVVDLIYDGEVYPFTLIRDETDDSEIIYDILVQENLVYLATTAGVRVLSLDLNQDEPWQIQESYVQLGATGETVAIYQSAIVDDSIFLATEAGVIANTLAPLVNRQDFNTWQRFDIVPGEETTRHLALSSGEFFVAVDQHAVYRYRSGRWEPTVLSTEAAFDGLASSNDGLLILTNGQSFRLGGSGEVVAVESETIRFAQAIVETENDLWIADQQQGLLRITNEQVEQFLPNGPVSDDIQKLSYANGAVIALKDEAPGAYAVFSDGQWQNYSGLPVASRLTDVAYAEPTQQYYFASLGEGVLQWDGQEGFSVLNQVSAGSTLENDQVTALLSNQNRLWLANYNAVSSLHLINLDDNRWQPVAFNRNTARYPRQLAQDFNQQVWMMIGNRDLDQPGSDLLVFDPENNDRLFISDRVNASQLPGRQLTDMAVDLDGQLWLTGSEGVAFFPTPEQVFSDATLLKPVFDRQFLLLGEFVTSVAVDGGNRKWVGTNSGLWLFSETGEELVYNFTTENSPLISDVILDIVANNQSGEVFIATDRGVVSFRSTATEGVFAHQSVKLFPNPVRQSFDGLVGIQGLVNQATVKITTVSGVLVQELQAVGGTATWDLRAYTGDRVQSGVYLVFSASADGSETFVGKIAVVP
ncbi:hypothetical protein [Tunicatimonas pelagia]|uniref:type IX secretion system anionic LPS delivery protein PorZ n=1 Tax=Tunicatimonas pelagia TaxID=931531 RepID=UPI00266635CD|nr:hypothetical protein [Tunicatimonas pelagia]WKN44486.1 hypothetical protein P0M28_05850 [Tunicatimonas pelagia]